MKHIFLAAAATLMLAAPAFPQTTGTGTGTATSNSASASTADAASQAMTGDSTSAVYIDQSGPEATKLTGTTTNRFAPAVAAPAMGSGHPCGLGNSLGISIIGGGVTGGATRVDDACLLAQMGYGPAAMQMIAARNPSACKALVAAGNVSAKSYCGEQKKQPVVSGAGIYKQPAVRPARGFNIDPARAAEANPANLRGAPAKTVTATNGVVCRLKAPGSRVIITDAVTPQQRAACVASLGL